MAAACRRGTGHSGSVKDGNLLTKRVTASEEIISCIYSIFIFMCLFTAAVSSSKCVLTYSNDGVVSE